MIAATLAFLAVPFSLATDLLDAKATNLLVNASFENLDGDRPQDWRPQTWSGEPQFAVEESFAHSGDRCLKVWSTQGADASWAHDLEVRPHTRYRLSVWVKTRNLDKQSGLGAQVNLHQLQMVGKTAAIHGTQDWTQLSSEFDSGSHSTLMVNLLFGGWGRSVGEAWFDDIEVVDLTPPLPAMSGADKTAFFETEIAPILEQNCFECHGPDSRLKGGLYLGSRAGVLAGGESGAAISTDDPFRSLLLSAINHETYEMPPSGKLPAADIERLTQWVRVGVPFAESFEKPRPQLEKRESGVPSIEDAAQNHWSFRPISDPVPPIEHDSKWPRHGVDHFIMKGLLDHGLQPSPEADRATLIRRATFDLLGLPPTLEEVRAFVADPDPNAYEKLLDRLLASPHYGEKWARHWLDLVRYAESNSFERDGKKPFVWRYRDYVIEAFNQDKPFDRFIIEQLAGDELPEVTRETLIATGYYRIGQWDDEPADPELARFDELDDIAATTSQVFLGLSMNCARCHDHKLDPIPQKDYYRFVSFFRGIRRYGVRSHPSVLERSVVDIATDEQRVTQKAASDEHQAKVAALEARITEIEEIVKPDFAPVEHEDFKNPEARVAMVEKRLGGLIDQKTLDEYKALKEQRKKMSRFRPPALDQALVVKERGATPPDTYVLIRGNPHVNGDQVEPGFPQVLSPPEPEIVAPANGKSSGRRLALAKWIASPDNPMTARVIVNRLWQFHFGQGLAASPNDFGLQGLPPTHPELIDFLASRLVENGWRLKPMHKLLMMSATYRQSSQVSADAARIDPQNQWWGRFSLRRLTAEELRDTILAVNGSLNKDEMFGPSFYSAIPKEVLAGQSRPGENWGNSPPEQRSRRSIYIHVKRSLITPILAAFDMADTDFTCPVRFATTQPTQALSMMNSAFLGEASRTFAEKLKTEAPDDVPAQVRRALAAVMQRPPRNEEVDRGLDLIERLRDQHGASPDLALQQFCLVALNLNEFVFLD